MQLNDEQIWDALGIVAEGDWTISDLWDRARLLGVQPAELFPDCYRSCLELGGGS